MARVFKGSSFDDGQFPMPPDPRGSAGAHGAATEGAPDPTFAGVEPAELQHALGELQQIVGMVAGMRPAVQELSSMLREGGREQGYGEGVARAQGEVQSQLIEVMSALTAAQAERHRLAQQHEGALADLAVQIARKVIAAHLELDPTLVARIVAEAIRELEPSTALIVRVHPDDLSTVEDARRELERLVQGDGRVDIEADPTVDVGGVVLVSPVGEVDAKISTKLSVLQTAFTAQRRALVDGA
ncbi:MAG: fliH [Thermoleophilia bacterium]|nr:fliH [Thermoleophilia bacterium]